MKPGVLRHTATALLMVPVAMLCGCMLGPDFTRPEAPTDQGYLALAEHPQTPKGAKDDAPSPFSQHVAMGQDLSGPWWNLFACAALDDVVKQALSGNRTLQEAASTLARAEEVTAAQSGGLYPSVAMTGGVGRQKYGDEFLGSEFKVPPFTYFAIGPTVSYAFDYTGGVARSVEARRALAEYQRQQLGAAGLAVSGNAVLQSLQVASTRAQIATLEALLVQDRENVKLVHEAFDAGSVSRLDSVTAESQLASDTALLPPLRQQLSVARHALAVVLGHSSGEARIPEFDMADFHLPQELPVSLPSALVHRRPDILAAEAQLHAATAAVGVADANLYPRVNLTASFGQQSVDSGQLFARASTAWGLAGGLTAPLFDGGTLRAEQRAAVAGMQASVAHYQQTVLVAFEQVADALQALTHDAEELDAQQRALEVAANNLELTRASYRAGNVGVLQVLDAERLYQKARLGEVRANAQRYVDTAQLYLALGGSQPGE